MHLFRQYLSIHTLYRLQHMTKLHHCSLIAHLPSLQDETMMRSMQLFENVM